MNEDELIYRIRFEGDTTDISSLIDPNALQGLVDLGKEIEATKDQLDSYQKQVKLGFPLSEEDRKNVEQLKLKLNDLRKEYQENQKAIANNDKALKANSNTYNGLVERNKALSQAMRELPLNDTTGALQRMQAEYNANNDALKQFDASMGNHQRNVGNYKDAFEGLSGVFGLLPSSMQGLSVAFAGVGQALDFAEKTTKEADGGFKAFFKTLMANPIGLIIIGVTALIGILSKLKPVTEALEKVFAVLGATLDTAVQYIEALISGTDRSTISLKNNTIAALNNLQAQKNLAAAQKTRSLDAAKLYAQEKKQLQISQDINKSQAERIAAFKLAQDIREEALIAEITYAERQIFALANLKDKEQEYNEALAEQTRLNADLVYLQQTKTQELADFEAQFIKTNDVAVKGLKEEKDLYADIRKAQQDAAFEFMFVNATLLESTEANFARYKELELERTKDALKNAKDIRDARLKAEDEIINRQIAYAQRQLDLDAQLKDERIGNMLKIAQAGTSIANSLFQENKKVAISTAIIDTLAAAVNVMRSPGNIFVKLAQSAAILAAGYANVRKIIATQPGSTSGGSSVPTANMGPAMPMGMIGSAFNPSGAMRFGPLTTGAAGSAAPFNARETQGITVYANVDRKGLAIAVREGERQIKTQQFTFAQ